jgi:assimilatory nitrate reductase catalytic subunit
VVQDAFRQTDTTAYADVLLPATTWGEKEGSVTNSERRITHVQPAIAAPGEALHDWAIAVDFARRLSRHLGRAEEGARLFPYLSPEEIFNEHRESTRGRDLDIAGLSYKTLDDCGPQQWPFPEGAARGAARLYSDGVFPKPDGRAHFANTQYRPPAEKTDARYPLHLNTGRLRDQWHGMSRTGRVPQLFNHEEEPVLYMHGSDMARRDISDGSMVRVSSRRGSLAVRVQTSLEVQPTHVFMPMHWGSQFMAGAGCNALTVADVDPVSKQPELKHAAIRVEKLDLPWRLVIMRRTANALAMQQALQRFLPLFDAASCGLYGREQGMVMLRAFSATAPSQAIIDQLDQALEITDDHPCLSYQDNKRGISKRIVVEAGAVTGVRLIGETLAAHWLREVMEQQDFPDAVRRWALAPVSAPPGGQQQRGRIVCNCLNVSENEIREVIATGAGLNELQAKLKCGTECGSCVPEIKRLLC